MSTSIQIMMFNASDVEWIVKHLWNTGTHVLIIMWTFEFRHGSFLLFMVILLLLTFKNMARKD